MSNRSSHGHTELLNTHGARSERPELVNRARAKRFRAENNPRRETATHRLRDRSRSTGRAITHG